MFSFVAEKDHLDLHFRQRRFSRQQYVDSTNNPILCVAGRTIKYKCVLLFREMPKTDQGKTFVLIKKKCREKKKRNIGMGSDHRQTVT